MKFVSRILILMVVVVLLLNFILPHNGFLLERSIDNQISFLEKKFSKQLDGQLQKVYPEGKLFSNLIFALSIIEYSNYKDGLDAKIVDNSIFASISGKAKSNYEEHLLLPYGAFYNGWINFTLKKYVESKLIASSPNKEKIVELHRQFTERIVKSQMDSVQLLDTYLGSIWPADNLLCIASLDEEYNSLKKEWLSKIKLTSKDELINHYGGDSTEVRGSSQALINYILLEIDADFSVKSNNKYKSRFEDKYMGISFIKEHESYDDFEDIDSGPIILGYGSVATIMNSKLKNRIKDKGYKTTFGFLNLLGIPINLFGNKYYLFGKEPMFDLFMLWSSVGILDKR